MVDIILVILVSVLLSGFFSGSEIAFFSLSEAKVHALLRKNRKRVRLVHALKTNPDRLLITILIGNNIVNIGSASLVTLQVTNEFGSEAVGWATGVMTFLVLTFGEIVPKTFATRFAVPFAIFSSVPLSILQFALLPLSIFFEGMSKLLHSFLKSGTISATETEEELTSLARLGYKKGRMEDLEYEVIRRIFTLNDTRVSKAMTKKENMFTLNGDDTLLSAIKQIRKHHFSRIPVYVGSQDNIKGFLYVRDIVTLPREKWSDIRVKNYIRPVIYVRPSTVLSDLYEDFIYKRTHMAIVRDKQKAVVGLITIEDIIEELVGEIEDETDTEAQK